MHNKLTAFYENFGHLICLKPTKMDTIRRKMYLLKVETSETINRLLTVETDAARTSESLKEREQKLRQLMKEVSKKENGRFFKTL